MSDIIKNIRVNVDFDPEGNIQKAQNDLANAAKGSGFEKEVKNINSELNKQALVYAEIARSQNRIKEIERDRAKVAGTDFAKKLNAELKEEKKLLGDLEKAYKKLSTASKNSFETAEKAAGKARGSFINLGDVLTTALGTSLGIGVASLADFIGEAIVKVGEFASEGIRLAAANEQIAKGQETTNEKIEKFNEILTDIQTGVGRILLPFFRNFVDVLNDVGEGFAEFLGTGTQLSDVVRGQQTDFNILANTLINVTEEAQKAGLSEEQLAIRQEERRQIINRINESYPDYLNNLFTEETSINEIRVAQKKANNEFLRRIELLARQEELQRLTQDAVKIQRQLLEIEKERTELQQELEEGTQSTGATPSSFGGSIVTTGNELAAATAKANSLREQLEAIRQEAASIEPVIIDFKVLTEDTDKDVRRGTDNARKIIAGTTAFLKQRAKEIRDELDFVVGINDIETRQRLKLELDKIEAELRRIDNLFTISPRPSLIEFRSRLEQDLRELESERNAFEIKGDFENASVVQAKIDKLVASIRELKEPIKLDIDAEVPNASKIVEAVIKAAKQAADDNGTVTEVLTDEEELKSDLENALQITQAATTSLGGLYDTLAENRINSENITDAEIKKIQLQQFERQKAFASVEAAIQGALMSIKFGTQSGLPGYLLGASLAATQVVAILARKAPGFKEGVFDLGNRDSYLSIPGKGTTTSDSIPAYLSRGESVVSAQRTLQNYDALKAIDSGQTLKPYQLAGQTVYSASPVSSVPKVSYPVVIASNSGIDYDKLADAIAKRTQKIEFAQEGKLEAAKAFAKQNEFVMHEFFKFLERKNVLGI